MREIGERAKRPSATGDGEGAEIARFEPRSDDSSAQPLSPAILAAVSEIAGLTPSAMVALRGAAQSGSGLSVAFNPDIIDGLRKGSLHLLQTKDGAMATAVDGGGRIVANARVMGSVTPGVAGKAGLLTAGALAIPIALAGLAAYQQQRQLESALASIEATLERVEARLEDADHGVCDAAELFIDLAARVSAQGPLPPYLRMELSAHRVAVEGVYGSRRRFVRRFKEALEREQNEWEKKKGERQPWVGRVEELAKEGRLEEELVLFVRTLLVQTRLDALVALCLAEEGAPAEAAQLLHDSAIELRSEFFDLHNRLRPLARIAPPRSIRNRLPLLTRHLDQAHEVAQVLVSQLDLHVLPMIPDPYRPPEIVIEIGASDVASLAEAHVA